MPIITLPDGSTRSYDLPVTPGDVAADIGPGLASRSQHTSKKLLKASKPRVRKSLSNSDDIGTRVNSSAMPYCGSFKLSFWDSRKKINKCSGWVQRKVSTRRPSDHNDADTTQGHPPAVQRRHERRRRTAAHERRGLSMDSGMVQLLCDS